MLIEGLLKKQVCKNEELSGMLTSVDGKPAFFHKKMPDGIDPEDLYSYAVYDINMQEESARNVRGTLLLHVYFNHENDCFDGESATELKNLELKLIDVISGTFYTPGTQESSVCAVWNRSTAFACESYPATESGAFATSIWGLKMTFDLMSFPIQITAEPDSLQVINEWTKSIFDSTRIITYDTLSEIWKPTNNQPAIYWRLKKIIASDDQSHTVAWFDCKIVGHVITNNITNRMIWLKTLAEELNIAGELPLTDESNFIIKNVTIKPGADQLRKGQITIEGRYGLIRKEPYDGPQLMDVSFR